LLLPAFCVTRRTGCLAASVALQVRARTRVSLVVSALLTALSNYLDAYLPFGHLILQALTFLISFSFITLLFGAIYKILPDSGLNGTTL
jgi:uncharacterized BrkB/YihY/UPF0761 family membrane protein